MFKKIATAYSENTNKIRQKTFAVAALSVAVIGAGLYLNAQGRKADLLGVTEAATEALNS